MNIGKHEKGHTYQAELLGLAYGPAYLLAGGFSGLKNPFEAAAQRYAKGEGHWWPWNVR